MATTKPKVTIRNARTVPATTGRTVGTTATVRGTTGTGARTTTPAAATTRTGGSSSQIEAAIRAAQANAGAAPTTPAAVTPDAETATAAATENAATEAAQAAAAPRGIQTTDTPAQALAKLFEQYNSGGYEPRTDAQRQERAEGQYQSYYNQLRLAARQQQARSDLALDQQGQNLARNYNDQREASAQQYANAYSQADRQLLSRGMQRSTYGAQTLANIATQGAEAQQQLWTRQGEDQAQIDAQRALLSQQLAQQLQQYDASQASDIMNRVRELEDQDYERGLAERQYQNQAAGQLYSYLLDAIKNGYLRNGTTGAVDTSAIASSISSAMARQMAAAGANNSSQQPTNQPKAMTDKDYVAYMNSQMPSPNTPAGVPSAAGTTRSVDAANSLLKILNRNVMSK